MLHRATPPLLGRRLIVHATDRVLAPNVLRPAAADVARVAEMLLASSSPVILAGNGVHASRAWSELTALADLLAIPVATTATGKSAIADVHPQALGVFGNWGQAVANEVVSTADTVLVVGSRMAPTDTCFENPELLDADRQRFLQIDVDDPFARKRAAHLHGRRPMRIGEHRILETNLVKRPENIGAELDAGADLPKLRGLLEDADRKTLAGERIAGCQPADSAASNENGLPEAVLGHVHVLRIERLRRSACLRGADQSLSAGAIGPQNQ